MISRRTETLEQYERAVRLWQSHPIPSAAELDKSLETFRILFAYHSGKIEDEAVTYQDTKDIFQSNKVYNYTGNPKAILKQRNQKLCYVFLKNKIVWNAPLSLGLILETHRILTEGSYNEWYLEKGELPGEFKKHDFPDAVWGSPAESAASDLKALLLEINVCRDQNILKSGTFFHGNFEIIRPFADGNGRVGRSLLNYYLIAHRYPPLVIYSEDKRQYYGCLKKYEKNKDLDPLYEFFKYETGKTWENALLLCGGKKQLG